MHMVVAWIFAAPTLVTFCLRIEVELTLSQQQVVCKGRRQRINKNPGNHGVVVCGPVIDPVFVQARVLQAIVHKLEDLHWPLGQSEQLVELHKGSALQSNAVQGVCKDVQIDEFCVMPIELNPSLRVVDAASILRGRRNDLTGIQLGREQLEHQAGDRELDPC